MGKSTYIKKMLIFSLVTFLLFAGGQKILASYGYGGGSSPIRFGCADPKALNFSTFVASDPSLCRYARAFIPKLPNTGLPLI